MMNKKKLDEDARKKKNIQIEINFNYLTYAAFFAAAAFFFM